MQAQNLPQTIIERWPSRRALADDIGVKLIVVHRWHQRGSIPAKYDAQILDAASARNIPLNWRELMDARSAHSGQLGRGLDARQLSESSCSENNHAPEIQQSGDS